MADWTNLNELSPFASPPNGNLDPFSLSYDVDALGLQSELDQWTNTSFALDGFSPILPEFDSTTTFDFNAGNSEISFPTTVLLTLEVESATKVIKPISKKRRSTITPSEEGEEEANATAVEEDKRKRNTAASARFRIKKKQREAALESSAKELSDKVSSLEAQILVLQTENGWLKGLIVDKSGKQALLDREIESVAKKVKVQEEEA